MFACSFVCLFACLFDCLIVCLSVGPLVLLVVLCMSAIWWVLRFACLDVSDIAPASLVNGPARCFCVCVGLCASERAGRRACWSGGHRLVGIGGDCWLLVAECWPLVAT